MQLNVLKPHMRDGEMAEAVEAALIQTLYASRLSLAIGAALGMALSTLLYFYCPCWPILFAGIALSVCGAFRAASFQLYSPRCETRRLWRMVYELGALGYAALLGILTALIILMSPRADLQLVAGVMATGYAAGAASRNTGRPAVAIGQFLLTQAPWTFALLARPSAVHVLLFISNLLFAAVVTDLTLRMYRTVLDALVDKQEKRLLADTYEKLSKTDPLTGLGNRTLLETSLASMLVTSSSPVAVAWLDLDQFKNINDTQGHGVGDRLLRRVATDLGTAAGDGGCAFRFGGDEFIIFRPVKDQSSALQLGGSLLEAVRSASAPDEVVPNITASIGLAVSGAGISADDLLRYADVALYEAKAHGRNRVEMFDPAMERALIHRKTLEQDLKRALQNNELELHFQPIVDLGTGRVASFEALIRWTHPEQGNVPAVTIITMAEAANIMEPLTDWVLRNACAAAMQWPDEISIAVNIPPTLVEHGALTNSIIGALMRSGLPATRLEIELTESAVLEDSPNSTRMLKTLQELGVRLSLDDFGTGYSSLSYLCRFQFDRIKIDRSFTHAAQSRDDAHAVIKAITSLARSMNLSVVAEGIETQSQADYIAGQGCGFGQGYLFAKPVPCSATFELIDKIFTMSVHTKSEGDTLRLAS